MLSREIFKQAITNNIVNSTALAALKPGDYIAFEFQYSADDDRYIEVANITLIDNDRVLVHFLYGHHSCSEFIKKEDIIAIGDISAKGKIKGWSGTFNILKPEHELLNFSE